MKQTERRSPPSVAGRSAAGAPWATQMNVITHDKHANYVAIRPALPPRVEQTGCQLNTVAGFPKLTRFTSCGEVTII